MTPGTGILDMHTLATFVTVDPDTGSEPGIGWNWLLQFCRLSSRVTAIVPREVHESLGADPRLPANVGLVCPDTYSRARSRLPVPGHYLDYAGFATAASALASDIEADIAHQVTLGTPYWGSAIEGARARKVLGPVSVSRPAPVWAASGFGLREMTQEAARQLMLQYPFPPVSAKQALDAADLVLAADGQAQKAARRRRRPVARMTQDGSNPVKPADLTEATSRRNLVWAGRLMPRKGAVLAVEAFATARPKLPGDVKLIVMGDGPQRPLLGSRVVELGVARHVELLGSRPRVDVLNLLASARALVRSCGGFGA
jgi:glycosyltransferase involved in cell wall biosynthesis